MTKRTKAPFHERVPPLGWIRGQARERFFRLFRRLGATDEFRSTVHSSVRPGAGSLAGDLATSAIGDRPYDGLGKASSGAQPSERTDIVIVTSRYRSGSTLLWNVFRHHPAFTAYYEPFNPRRWFDPRSRGDRVDPSHDGVADYWREYEGAEDLAASFDGNWYCDRLFMGAREWAPRMLDYVETLIRRAAARPLLQFNLIDFRLPWFRSNFPGAKLVHLYRHPREAWCSSLGEEGRIRCGPEITMADFQDDRFYLRTWCRDLRYTFPILDPAEAEHPYDLYYTLWVLSYLIGQTYADITLSYEELTRRPSEKIAELLTALDAPPDEAPQLAELVSPPAAGRAGEYADEAWFRGRESRCEDVIRRFLGAGFPTTV